MRRGFLGAACLLLVLASGCAALTNPVADAVPVRRVPPELLAPPREDDQTIPLTVLGQPRADVYRLAPGDVVGVHIDGILGDRTAPIPFHVAPPVQFRDQRRLEPGIGHPLTVQPDGTLVLPRVPPLRVDGMSVLQVTEAIRKHYADRNLLKVDVDRVLVSLLQPRQYQVLVFRQEAANFSTGNQGFASTSKRGTGHVLDLPAFENDVLHALALSGGLPGLDAYNEVIIFRRSFQDPATAKMLAQQLENCRGPFQAVLAPHSPEVIRIPLRQPCGQPAPFRPCDVILQSGDVVLLEARDSDVFYTGGLLPSGAHILPRDDDLDVLEAVVRVGGPLFNGAFGGSNLNGTLIQPGIGNPSPSNLVVVRRTHGGGQVPIRVDLRRAMTDARERIRVMPGDLLVLQETPGEALTRYFTQTFFNFNLAWEAIHGRFISGFIDVSTPDRLPDRLPNVNVPLR